MSALSTDPDDDAKMFDLAPVSLWIEDYSAVRALFEQWRAEGVTESRHSSPTTPIASGSARSASASSRSTARPLSLFGARDLDHLMANLGRVMRDDTFKSHVEELVQLWDGQASFSSHTVNYTLAGERLDIQLTARSFLATSRAGTAS